MSRSTRSEATRTRVVDPTGGRSGVGSIEELPSGRFRVRVYVRGKKKGDVFATREEAERQRAQLAVRHRQVAEARPPKPEALTVDVWGETWLARRIELGEVRYPKRDRTRWNTYVAGSALAKLALAEIRPKHVQQWLDGMRVRPLARGKGRLSPQTVRRVYALLRLALADAMRAEHTDTNAALGVKLPKPTEPGWTFLDVAEIERVKAGTPTVPDEARRVFVFAIFTGLRQGEILALRYGDLTLDGPRPEVHVQRSHKGPPKSGKTRRVPLLPDALEALRGQLAHARREGDGTAPDDLVWPSHFGFQRTPNDDFGWSTRKRRRGAPNGYREALGIARRVKFHELRHTTASHLVMGTWTPAPLDLAAVQAWMGHAEITTTMKYAHLAPGYLHDRVRGTGGGGANGGGGSGGVGRGTVGDVPRMEASAVKDEEIGAVSSGPGRRSTGAPTSSRWASARTRSSPASAPSRARTARCSSPCSAANARRCARSGPTSRPRSRSGSTGCCSSNPTGAFPPRRRPSTRSSRSPRPRGRARSPRCSRSSTRTRPRS